MNLRELCAVWSALTPWEAPGEVAVPAAGERLVTFSTRGLVEGLLTDIGFWVEGEDYSATGTPVSLVLISGKSLSDQSAPETLTVGDVLATYTATLTRDGSLFRLPTPRRIPRGEAIGLRVKNATGAPVNAWGLLAGVRWSDEVADQLRAELAPGVGILSGPRGPAGAFCARGS